jgi:hypothetical protein
MALKQKDKDWIKQTIGEEFKAALFREITISRMAKGPGDIEGKIETDTINLLDILAQSLPQWEQSLRESSESSNQARNRSIETLGKINAVGETLVSMEESVMTMARFALVLKETGLLEQLEKVIEIEYKNPKAIEDEANTG